MSEHFNQWQVIAYSGKNRNVILGKSYVRASTAAQAVDLGRSALRLIGVRGRFNVDAIPYSPLGDWAFSGFIRKVGGT